MIDLTIIITYMLITFVLGIYSGRNIKTSLDYTVAGKKYNTLILTMTFIATGFGAGSTIGDVAKVSRDGIIFTFSMCGAFISMILIQRYAKKYIDHRFNNMMSAGDVMSYFYGKDIEIITGIIGFFASALTVGGQLTAVGNVFSNLLEINYNIIVLFSGITIMLYVASGGVKSVTITDILQFIIIVTVIPAVVVWLLNKSGGISQIMQHTDEIKLSIFSSPKKMEYAILFLCSMLPFMWLHPPVIQRYLMAKDGGTISRIYKSEIALRFIFGVILVPFLALSASYLFPETHPSQLISRVIKDAMPEGVRGFFLLSVLAAAMSTADSHLNASTILITRNVINLKKKSNHKSFLRIARLSTIVIGSTGILIAMKNFDITELIIYAFSLWGAIVMIPMVIAVLRLPHSKLSFYISLTGASIALITASKCGLRGFLPGNIAILASISSFTLSELAQRYYRNRTH